MGVLTGISILISPDKVSMGHP
jgi:hypothetical protein